MSRRLKIFSYLQQVLLPRVLRPLPAIGLVDQELDVVLVDAHLEHQSAGQNMVTSLLTLLTSSDHLPDIGVKGIHLEIKHTGKTYEIFFLTRQLASQSKD